MAAVPAPIAGRRSGGRTTQLLFRGFLVFSLLVGFATLAVLLIDVLRDGLPYLTMQLFTDPPSSSPELGLPSGPSLSNICIASGTKAA